MSINLIKISYEATSLSQKNLRNIFRQRVVPNVSIYAIIFRSSFSYFKALCNDSDSTLDVTFLHSFPKLDLAFMLLSLACHVAGNNSIFLKYTRDSI